ncbi:MAG: phosphoribosylaminoimidazolesuccinocarboxamide synthase [Burkholderiaceae bacterium]
MNPTSKTPSRSQPLRTSDLKSLPLIGRGKVRDNYAVGSDRMLMVTTDRLSAFDVVMNEPIPGKGEALTRMALFWFAQLADVIPNHLTGLDPESVVAPDEREQVRHRSMLVKRLNPLPIEAVVRGYLIGSGWKDYQQSGGICGIQLPPACARPRRCPRSCSRRRKAAAGEHDENITFAQMADTIGVALADQVREVSVTLYERARDIAAVRGIIIADTKFEFGLDANGQLTLMDEILTADSSRFWPADTYEVGLSPPSFDKQFVRDYLESVSGWNKQPPPPALPAEVIARTADKYREALRLLTGSDIAGA